MNKTTREKSVGFKNERLASEWNYEKNGDLSPYDFPSSSPMRVYWVCEQKHEWMCSISKRSGGNNCPICYQQSFAKKNPLTDYVDVCSEWNYDKNESLSPASFSKGSNRKVWWKCKMEHEWEATISSRTKGNGCPMCAGKKVTQENCLAIAFPHIAKEWHLDKNELTPFDVTPSSGKRVWWKCENNHEWKAAIFSRQTKGCAECQGFKVRDKSDIYSSNGTKKICNICDEELDLEDFHCKMHSNGKTYYNPACKKCENEYATTTASSKLGIARDIVYRKKTVCKKENMPFDLTPEWVLYRLNEIGWKCELTGLPMKSNRDGTKSRGEKYEFCWNSISVDRIVPNKGYVKTNVRFVLNQINAFKTDGDDDRMCMIAKALLDCQGYSNE